MQGVLHLDAASHHTHTHTHADKSQNTHDTVHTTRDSAIHISTGAGERFPKSLCLHRIARFALVGVGVVRLLVAGARRRGSFRPKRCPLSPPTELDEGYDDLFVAWLRNSYSQLWWQIK